MSQLTKFYYNNKVELINLFNIILDNLEKKNIIVNDKNDFFNNFIRLFYKFSL